MEDRQAGDRQETGDRQAGDIQETEGDGDMLEKDGIRETDRRQETGDRIQET